MLNETIISDSNIKDNDSYEVNNSNYSIKKTNKKISEKINEKISERTYEKISEKTIGNTTYIVSSECSPNATETLTQKLERIIKRNAMTVCL